MPKKGFEKLHIVMIMYLSAVVSACGTFVPVVDLEAVPAQELEASRHVRIYTLGVTPLELGEYIAEVEAYSCKHLLTDPPASKGDALSQLKYKAHQLGADAVINVTFDTRGTDTWGTNCWETVYASGSAVSLNMSSDDP